jgi:hypothetical protein
VKADFRWSIDAQNNSNTLAITSAAVGPANQILLLRHTFFRVNGTAMPLGGSQPIGVQEGYIKLTIYVALWSFKSPSNSLAINFFARTNDTVTGIRQSTTVDNQTEYVFTTPQLKGIFTALPFAVYDWMVRWIAVELHHGIDVRIDSPQQAVFV